MDNNGYAMPPPAYPPPMGAIVGGSQAPGNKGPSLVTATQSADYLLKTLSEAVGRLTRVNSVLGGPVPAEGNAATGKPQQAGGVHQLADTLGSAQSVAQTIHNEISRLEQLVGIG